MHKQNRLSKRGQKDNAPPTANFKSDLTVSVLIEELTRTSYKDTDGIYKDPLTDEPIDPQPWTTDWWQERYTEAQRRAKIKRGICPDCQRDLFKIRGNFTQKYGWDEVAVSCTVCDFHTCLLVNFSEVT